jgi:calcineurin-like phosphoesterase family protein
MPEPKLLHTSSLPGGVDTTKEVISSRTSREGAGWECTQVSSVDDLVMEGAQLRTFRWIDPRPLWISRNDKIARWFGDPTNEERRRWVEAKLAEGVSPDLIVHREKDTTSFLIVGDTGEGDKSQYFVLRPMWACAKGIDFIYMCSDVIYPAGDINEYDEKFFWPYREFPGPIYAIPGNHDWYDGLQGFMAHFCAARPELRPPGRPVGKRWQRAGRRLFWRKPSSPDEARIEAMRARRSSEEQLSKQPAPYFAINTGPILLVGIDTGITGTLDEDQGRWLREVSKVDKPKILLTGKPLVVDAEPKTTKIEPSGTVNEIVEASAHQYIAVIGGDIHNYQRYPARLEDGRVVQYIVSGAGGAYTHATHKIPRVEREKCRCEEDDFRCYPRRGDSLAVYSRLYDDFRHRVLRVVKRGRWVVPYEQAPLIVKERLQGGPDPTRPEDAAEQITPEARKAASRVYPLPGRGSGMFHTLFSEILDWDEPPPPLFKSFMRVEASEGLVDIKCFAATGCREHEENPPLEDWITATLAEDGIWEWQVRL